MHLHFAELPLRTGVQCSRALPALAEHLSGGARCA